MLTWNLLFDRYDDHIFRLGERLPVLLGELERADADLIAVQEVVARSWDALRAEPWVQQGFHLTWGGVAGLNPYGQVVLTRGRVQEPRLLGVVGKKTVVVSTVQLGTHCIDVAVVHLSSDHRGDAAERRGHQLEQLVAQLREDALIIGDLNMGDDEFPTALWGWTDAWTTLRPDAPGATWDPTTNALAAAHKPEASPRRLDRVLLRGSWARPVSAELVADAWPGPLPPSDHAGLLVELELTEP